MPAPLELTVKTIQKSRTSPENGEDKRAKNEGGCALHRPGGDLSKQEQSRGLRCSGWPGRTLGRCSRIEETYCVLEMSEGG